MSTLSMRLSDDVSQQLEALAAATGRITSFLAGQTICDFLNREAWQMAEIQQALQKADAGDFATDEGGRCGHEMEAPYALEGCEPHGRIGKRSCMSGRRPSPGGRRNDRRNYGPGRDAERFPGSRNGTAAMRKLGDVGR